MHGHVTRGMSGNPLEPDLVAERECPRFPPCQLMACRCGVPAAPLLRGAAVRSAINDNAVAAGALGRVADPVGGSQYLIDGAAVGADGHHADGHRDVDGLVVAREAERADGPLHGFGDALDLSQRAVLHEDREGVATHPRQGVAPADLSSVFIGGGVCSTISPPRRAGSTGYPGEAPMLELNLLFSRIKNMQERVDALRGYL